MREPQSPLEVLHGKSYAVQTIEWNLKGPKHGSQMPKTKLNQYHTDNMSVWT